MPEDTNPQYRLSAVLSGHSNDVRCLATARANAISGANFSDSSQALVSGSRDLKAKLWVTNPATKDLEWREERQFEGHKRYVSSLIYMQPNEDFPEGLIYTGCISGIIRAFSPCNSEAVMETEAHENSVSTLFVSHTGTLLSGSWDHTAKVWINKLKLVMTLKGHQNSIWAVLIMPNCNVMVTASADKSIRLWKAGACTSSIPDAHTQAIRSMTIGQATDNTFLTTGNDGEVKLWKIDPELATASLMHAVKAHDHFLYTMTMLDQTSWAAAGENSGVKIFQGDKELQVLPIPAISVWCLTTLLNGDIAASASDGRIWIFSANSKRQAEEEIRKFYELELSKFQRPATTELEGIDIKDLPGPNSLLSPGFKDGQTKMVNDGGIISVHSWSQAEQRWTKIGDVVGQPEDHQSSGASPSGGKVTYMGKEYDYVFNIELDEGGKLKLPYNKDQDVWMVAQKFIHDHQLPQDNLETIAQFLTTNTGGDSRQAPSAGQSWDPLTGGSAYTSGSSDMTSSGFSDFDAMDVDNPYIPCHQLLKFDAKNKQELVNKKLKEFNDAAPVNQKISPVNLERLYFLSSSEFKSNAEDLDTLLTLLSTWSSEKIFPALDILRLAVLNESIQDLLNQKEVYVTIHDLFLKNLTKTSEACLMLSARGLVNLFSSYKGKLLMVQKCSEVMLALSTNGILPCNKNSQIALSTVMVNYAVTLCQLEQSEGQIQCANVISTLFLTSVTDGEAQFRTLVALGTLAKASKQNREALIDLGTKHVLQQWSAATLDKRVKSCADFLVKIL